MQNDEQHNTTRMMVSKKAQLVMEGQMCDKIMKYAGDATHLSKMIGVSASTALGWQTRKRISKAGAKLIANHPFFVEQGILASDIRLDLNIGGNGDDQ